MLGSIGNSTKFEIIRVFYQCNLSYLDCVHMINNVVLNLSTSFMPGLLINDEGSEFENCQENLPASKSGAGAGKLDRESYTEVTKELVLDDLEGCILKCKSVFKCRLCPRIVCLTEATMTAHLKSKVRFPWYILLLK